MTAGPPPPTAEGPPGRILVVCTGNICRSPYLEHLLRNSLDRQWGPGRIVVGSAGLRGLQGDPMFPPAAAQLHARGLAATGFRARRLEAVHVAQADLVLAVTREHRAAVLRLVPAALRRTVTPAEVALAEGTVRRVDSGEPDLARYLRAAAAAVVSARPSLSSLDQADLDIEDPYGRSEQAYIQMAEQVQRIFADLLAALSPAGSAVEE
ncbi:MAG TPA: low molecular weight phosphatase family protein [Ornithinimicrobium sp.]|uniref:arsenate-mycothiol transferase ArsC n=1 Tax=Ornithinimicrobium sp. TaxID=1977084 RepID=UPI002B47F443|nr:low molecular weight phosphatase family protein [Ornithinimicrobium sp.]HKJ13135.1 low molecular weight phosphatase family protein [Ornithinimicrobium sp.]